MKAAKMIKVAKRFSTALSLYAGVMMFVSRAARKSDHTYSIAGYNVVADDHKFNDLNMLAETRYMASRTIHIATDGLFELLPETIQECIVCHEVGHLVLDGGMPEDMAVYTAMRAAGICPHEEKVADSMMVQIHGKKAAIKALLVMALLYPAGIHEIVQRIVAILKN